MSSVIISGDTSGAITLAAPAVAGTNTITLPAAAGSVVLTDVAGTVALAATGANIITASTNGTERMRINSSGDVFIGCTTNPNSTTAGRFIGGTSYDQRSCGTTTTTYQHFYFTNGNGNVGTITTNGSSTAYNTSSDYRLKENVVPMTGALDKVALLKPVTYKWKADGSNGEGFIAHELQEIMPDCVTGVKDEVDAESNPIHQAVDVSFLVATLTAAIQELNAKVDAQAAEIASLKGVA
jgi:hypothetical protein